MRSRLISGLGGEKLVSEGAKNLLKLKKNVEGTKPSFLMVLTAVGAAYKRDDGCCYRYSNEFRCSS